MRPPRFGIVVLTLAVAYFGAIVLRAYYRTPVSPPTQRYRVTDRDVREAKSLLCRLGRTEHAFRAATGHYGNDLELRADNNPALPPSQTLPYFYSIHVPVPERFVIVATAYGALDGHPPALLVDDRLRLCTVRSDLPNAVEQLDDLGKLHSSQRWGHTSYECTPCDQIDGSRRMN